ncbi:GNAT family N-acetyltransferase [Achromobacter dolens]|uniref:GNAT family N-acetyltransferase n=1 Tax=Achromobacter dolens TaxID=1287738 RepID=UPI000A6116FA|nr:GNAT family N-acetyltransferase [Achromobacter dolens]
MPHPDQSRLDNPAWFALAERQAHLRQGDGLAARYQPDVAPFAALRNTTREAFAALERLMAPDQAVLVQTLAALPPVDGLRSETLFSFFQMVDEAPAPAVDDDALHALPLHAGDVADMMALAAATRPGPFGLRTIETGRYLGVRRAGRLVAMAGERMQLEGYVEISAVCVDPDCRGQGLAVRLMNRLRRDIRLRGDIPFLHVRDDNTTAIALYQRLGFRTRQTFQLQRVAAPDMAGLMGL